MKKVRYGIIGVGNMGTAHIRVFLAEKIKNGVVTAVCDTNRERLEKAKNLAGEDVAAFTDSNELIKSGKVDAVLVATPHYFHPPIAISALENKVHALVEKPAGVYTKQIAQMNETAKKHSDICFGIMFNNRTSPVYQKARELVKSGELGELKRTNWIITDWYRAQCYYDSGDWRATWAGEGGGVLLNQSPHQLDLWQWICGMPVKVRAFCHEGKFHRIEVEDDVTAYVEYENKATGVFITTTGDAPGSNRFEITGDKGKILIEEDKLKFWSLRESEKEFRTRTKNPFATPETWEIQIPLKGEATQHVGIINNFTNSVLTGESLIARGEEGINSVELANAMLLSSWTDKTIDIPLDRDYYLEKLEEKIKGSKIKKEVKEETFDLDDSF